MKRFVAFSIVLFFANVYVKAQQWAFVGGAAFTSTSVSTTALAVDASNTIYMGYGNNTFRTTVVKYVNNVWTTVGAAGFSPGPVLDMKMAINKNNGYIYVLFIDVVNGSRATVMRYDGNSWQVVGAAGFSPTQVFDPCLALDNNGMPVVAFIDNISKAIMMKYNGSAWVAVGAPASDGEAANLAMDVDGSNIPYVAYTDPTAGNKTTLRRYNGSTWVTIGYKGISTGITTVNVVTIDNNNIPYVAFGDYSYNKEAVVKKFANNSWSTVGTEGFTAGEVLYPNMAFDSNNIPYLACSDEGYTSRIVVRKFEGNWNIVGSATFTPSYVREVSFAIDGNNALYAAYQDLYANNKASVIKYSSAPTINTSSVSNIYNCPGASVNVGFTTSGPFNNGNVFTAQLSDPSGAFIAPSDIGTLTGTTSGTIAAVLPYTAAYGVNYKIRVVASNPSVAGTPYSGIYISDATNSTTKSFVGSGDWNNPSKWSPCGVPPANAELTIGSTASVTVPAGYAASAKKVTVAPGGAVRIKATGSLTISGLPVGGKIADTTLLHTPEVKLKAE